MIIGKIYISGRYKNLGAHFHIFMQYVIILDFRL